MRLLTLLLVATVLIAPSTGIAAGPIEESAVVVLRGSSAPPTPWYEPPPSPPPPQVVEVRYVPYVLPFYYLPFSTFVLHDRLAPHRQTMMAAPRRQ
jgi:hypothetical protein